MNFTDYSDHFKIKNFIACISHRDHDYKYVSNIGAFVSNLSLDKKNLVIPKGKKNVVKDFIITTKLID